MRKQNLLNQKSVVTFFIGLTTVLLTNQAKAELYAPEQGLDKIKTNVENAQSNKEDYSKNLDVINKNVAEVNRAKSETQKQKDSVNAEILKNNDSLKKVLLQEKEIQNLVTQEEQKKEQENKQIANLEQMLAQVKQNQAKRDALIAEYKTQLNLATEEKKAWKNRETELRAQESKTIQSLRTLANDESTWTTKKKTYEGEVKKWTSEADKQQKISETYQGLKDGK